MPRAPDRQDPALVVRPVHGPHELAWVAARMRETLLEVVGRDLYTPDWLLARAQHHVDHGAVFVAARGERVIGHTLVRVDGGVGLFSTTYVVPDARRAGAAHALLDAGERWLLAQGVPELTTWTSATNTPLIRLYQGRGYTVVERAPGPDMVRLARPVG